MNAKSFDQTSERLTLNDQILLVFRDHNRQSSVSRSLIVMANSSSEKVKKQLVEVLRDLSEIKKIEVAILRVGHIDLDIKSILKELKIFRHRELIRSSPCQAILHSEFGRLQVEKEQTPSPVNAVSAKTRILIVDDSKTIRSILSKILSRDSDMEVVGEAERPSQVMGLIESLKPNVITLDIGLPEMNGVELLKIYLKKYRIPTVMISALSREESPLVLQSLEAGAVDYIQKPSFEEITLLGPVIAEKVKNASRAKVQVNGLGRLSRLTGEMRQDHLLAIGASTGGTEAIKALLMQLPEKIPPTAIVQHIPPVFSAAFAQSLNSLCPFEVREAKNGDRLLPNQVLIAPGGFQMKLKKRQNGEIEVIVDDSPPVNRHKPSVDYMFDSVAAEFGKKAVGVILTGMGADGAQGLLKMKEAGAFTLGQDEDSCVVYGMPRAAFDLGAVEKVLPLGKMAEFLREKMRKV